MKILFLAGVAALISSQAFAQTEASLATQTGHEVNVGVSSYTYTEPGALSISIAGPKFGGDYTGTLSIDKNRHWFAVANVRGTVGDVTYTGWCSPWLIIPDSTSPNGYALDEGDASPCGETGDKDWYLETRGQVGKDWSADLGVVTLRRCGFPSFVERHDRPLRLPHRQLPLSAVRRHGAHPGRVASRPEFHAGIRPPDSWLAENPRRGIGWRRCTGHVDSAGLHN